MVHNKVRDRRLDFHVCLWREKQRTETSDVFAIVDVFIKFKVQGPIPSKLHSWEPVVDKDSPFMGLIELALPLGQ